MKNDYDRKDDGDGSKRYYSHLEFILWLVPEKTARIGSKPKCVLNGSLDVRGVVMLY